MLLFNEHATQAQDAGAFDPGAAAAATGVGTLLTIALINAPLSTLALLFIATSTGAAIASMGSSADIFLADQDPDLYVPGAAAWELENPPRPWDSPIVDI